MCELHFLSKNSVTRSMFLALSLLIVVSMVSCAGDEETTQNSVELIDRAYEKGVIDYNMRALYLTYSIYKPEALPQEYQSNMPMKDATPIILEIQRNWDRLSLETQEKISQYIQPLKKPGVP